MEPLTLRNHLIICGLNSTSLAIIEELESLKSAQQKLTGEDHQLQAMDYCVIDSDELALSAATETYAHFHGIAGDASSDDILQAANIEQAFGIFPVLEDNKDNIFITFSSRRMNPKIRIVARANDLIYIEEKFKHAGVDAVVSPNFIGGMRLVSELVRPDAVDFLDQLLRQKNIELKLEEIQLPLALSIGDDLISPDTTQFDKVQVIGMKRQGSSAYVYNPGADVTLGKSDTLVVLGDINQVRELKRTLKHMAQSGGTINK